MAIDTGSFDPINYYLDEIKPRLSENAEKYIDNLLEQADINIGENERLSDEFKKADTQNQNDNKRLSKFKGWLTFFWFLFALGIVGLLIGIFMAVSNKNSLPGIITAIVAGVIMIASLLVNLLYFNKKVKECKALANKSKSIADDYYKQAKDLLDPVHSKFQFDDFNKILRETTDIFEIDDYLKPEKLLMLKKVYGYIEDLTKDESIVDVLSGSIKGNPFIRLNVKRMSMFNKVYHGSRVVTYTEHYTDSEGRSRTRMVTETLHATYSAPCPSYGITSYMIYGNCAAPDLRFTRRPSNTPYKPTEKELDKEVKKREKELEKIAEKSIKNGGNFMPLANTKFETLFKAYDRNNEVQYRLLFTPLAQQNMVEVLTGKAGFGDDFAFFKLNKTNILCSKHGGMTYWYTGFENNYDVRELKKEFIETIGDIFDSLFFDLVPFLAIPLYQSTEGGIFKPDEDLPNVCEYEAESYANNSNSEIFRPEKTSTQQILKASFVKSDGKTDMYTVTSYAHQIFKRVYTAMVTAGNGVTYAVDVPWDEYIERSSNTPITVKNYMGSRSDYDNLVSDKDYESHVKNFSNRGYKVKRFVGYQLLNNFNDDYDKILDGDYEKYTTKD